MKSAQLFIGCWLFLVCCPGVYGQSWLGFNAAVPKVAPGYGSSVSVATPGVAPTGTSPVAPTLVPTNRPWKLGVVVRNTDVGAIVQTVEPNSAAQAAGIIPNDIIIAVSGTRIGEFEGRVVDIGEEIKRYVDGLGRVPLRSVLTVQLQNLTRPFYEVAGGKSVLKAEGTGPFRFDLFLDPRYISPTDQYQLNAYISWNNQVLYSLRQPMVVPVQGFGQLYNLSLDRASAPSVPPTIPVANIPATSIPATGFPATGTSGVITASLPAAPALPGQVSTDALNQIFVSLLGRQPSSRELIAWQEYMQQGHTLNDVAAKIMASPQFKERYATDQAYVQQVIQTLTGKLATTNDVNYWVGRMQALGSPEKMIAELTAQKR
jgi:hypothetical protein